MRTSRVSARYKGLHCCDTYGGLCRNILGSIVLVLALEMGEEIKCSTALFLSVSRMNSQTRLILFKFPKHSYSPMGLTIKLCRLLYHSIQLN